MVKTTERHGEAPLKYDPSSGYELKKAWLSTHEFLTLNKKIVKVFMRSQTNSGVICPMQQRDKLGGGGEELAAVGRDGRRWDDIGSGVRVNPFWIF